MRASSVLATGSGSHALGRHDGQVVAFGDLNSFEERVEAFLLGKQDSAVTVVRASSGGVEHEIRHFERGQPGVLGGSSQVLACAQGADADTSSRMRLD